MTDRSRRKNDAGRRARALLAVLFAAAAAAGCGGPGAERDPAAVAEDRGAWRADVRISSARLQEAMDAGDCDTAIYILEKVHSDTPGIGPLLRGMTHEIGGDCAPQDWARARSFYERAVAEGNSDAYAYLGHIYMRGLGVSADAVQAGYWYRGFAASLASSSPEARLISVRSVMSRREIDAALREALDWRQSIEARSPDDWLDLARALERGDNLPRNSRLARDWADKAMRGGSARAPVVYARLAFKEATEKSIQNGLVALEVAGAEGNRHARLDLARRFEQGDGVEQSDWEAYQWLLLAQESGELVLEKLREIGARLSATQIQIAELSARRIQEHTRRNASVPSAGQPSGTPEVGTGRDAGEKNSPTVRRTDCDSPMPPSDAPALRRGAALLARGERIVFGECGAPDWGRARRYFDQAAALGDSAAYEFLGHIYARGRGGQADPIRARYWYRGAAAASIGKPAEERLPDAISRMWVLGFDNDYREALDWVRGVEGQTSDEWYALAQRIERGDGLPRNARTAERWMRKAALAGNNEARVALATWILDGRSGAGEPWFGWFQIELAARDGHIPAIVGLADRLAAGRGLPRNDPHAFFWLLVAKARGADVSSRLADVGARLTAGEREKAAEWARDPNSSPAASDSILSRRKLLQSDR